MSTGVDLLPVAAAVAQAIHKVHTEQNTFAKIQMPFPCHPLW